MATDAGVIELQPGVDSEKHGQNLQQGVAKTLSDAVGTQITPGQLVPPSLQQPKISTIPTNDPGMEIDWGEHIGAEMGMSPILTEPNQGPLAILKRKILRQNPGKVLEPEK